MWGATEVPWFVQLGEEVTEGDIVTAYGSTHGSGGTVLSSDRRCEGLGCVGLTREAATCGHCDAVGPAGPARAGRAEQS